MSIPPALPPPLPSRQSPTVTIAPAADPEVGYKAGLRRALDKGWVVVADGPSGAQLAGPRKVRLLTWVFGVGGVALAVFFNLFAGLLFIALSLGNHAMSPRDTRYLPR
ncbi:MAG: hypothetical protein ACREIA_01360 [Opitutaceae bacterium]